MMTRTDYIAIAAILKAERKAIGANVSPLLTTQARLAIDHITRELADLMAAGNPRFDRTRFCAAAGMQYEAHTAIITQAGTTGYLLASPPEGYLVTCPHGCNLGDTARQATREGAQRRVDLHRVATS